MVLQLLLCYIGFTVAALCLHRTSILVHVTVLGVNGGCWTLFLVSLMLVDFSCQCIEALLFVCAYYINKYMVQWNCQ